MKVAEKKQSKYSNASSPVSTGSDEEERQTLLPNGRSYVADQEIRDKHVFDAVDGLNKLFLAISITVLLVLILILVDEFTARVVPIWGIFLVIWLGHVALFLISLSIARLLLSSVLSKSERVRFSQRWHQANEKRIPLIQFVLFQLLWILSLSFALVIFEILLYLAIVEVTSYLPVLIFSYIIIGGALLFAFLCRLVIDR